MASSISTRLASAFRGVATAIVKAAVPATTVPGYAVNTGRGWWGTLREGSWGGWQRGITVDTTEGILAFSAVYACIDLISSDIAKLRPKLMQLTTDGIWRETSSAAFSPVLRKPNHYQTRIQFLSAWVISKLIHGNTYVFKERDLRGVVVGLHVLNANLVKPLVAENGEVFYSLSRDKLAQAESVVVPASEIIHDRAACLFHPLLGVPPIFACAMSATQGNRIQANSATFFENMSRPSGQLTAPYTINTETADRLKKDFEENFAGSKIGRLLVAGDGLKYEPMTIPALQAQLIEQQRWTVEDVGRAFHVPLHKIASDSGVKYANMTALNEDYYSQCLQTHIEAIEVLLDEGLGLSGGPQTLGVELDLDGLLRMDPLTAAQVAGEYLKSSTMAPNEARARIGLAPVKGGDAPLAQQQNYTLEQLAARGAAPDDSQPPAAKTHETMKRILDHIEAAAWAHRRRTTAEVIPTEDTTRFIGGHDE